MKIKNYTLSQSKLIKILNQANWKAFLFFTTFTSIVWLLLQFTKEHTADYQLKIILTEIPVKEILSSKEVMVDVSVQQTGFALLKNQLSNKQIKLPVNALEKNSTFYVFDGNKFKNQIANELNLKNEDFIILSEKIQLQFSLKSSKVVPIRVPISISYAASFASYKGIEFSEDSVSIAGDANQLKDIRYIDTEDLVLKNLKTNQSGTIKLINPLPALISLEFESVKYMVEVEKFTEREFSIPVQLKNTPEEYQVSLFPDEIKVKFQSSVDDMEQINQDDFEIECDFKESLPEAAMLIPKLINAPEKAIRIRMSTQQVEYVLRKINTP